MAGLHSLTSLARHCGGVRNRTRAHGRLRVPRARLRCHIRRTGTSIPTANRCSNSCEASSPSRRSPRTRPDDTCTARSSTPRSSGSTNGSAGTSGRSATISGRLSLVRGCSHRTPRPPAGGRACRRTCDGAAGALAEIRGTRGEQPEGHAVCRPLRPRAAGLHARPRRAAVPLLATGHARRLGARTAIERQAGRPALRGVFWMSPRSADDPGARLGAAGARRQPLAPDARRHRRAHGGHHLLAVGTTEPARAAGRSVVPGVALQLARRRPLRRRPGEGHRSAMDVCAGMDDHHDAVRRSVRAAVGRQVPRGWHGAKSGCGAPGCGQSACVRWCW